MRTTHLAEADPLPFDEYANTLCNFGSAQAGYYPKDNAKYVQLVEMARSTRASCQQHHERRMQQDPNSRFCAVEHVTEVHDQAQHGLKHLLHVLRAEQGLHNSAFDVEQCGNNLTLILSDLWSTDDEDRLDWYEGSAVEIEFVAAGSFGMWRAANMGDPEQGDVMVHLRGESTITVVEAPHEEEELMCATGEVHTGQLITKRAAATRITATTATAVVWIRTSNVAVRERKSVSLCHVFSSIFNVHGNGTTSEHEWDARLFHRCMRIALRELNME